MNIAIIIPVYNALDDVKRCINSIFKHANFDFTSVIAVDDCSREDTAEYLRETAENSNGKLKLVRNEENLGFVQSCNRGLSSVDADIYVLLNSDTEIPQNFCERIIKCFESDSNIGVASPIASHSCRYYIAKPLNMAFEDVDNKILETNTPKYPAIPSAEGFCFCIRKEVIEKIGMLDLAYGKGYCEEVDFSYRAIKAGFRCALIDNMYVYHRRNCSFGAEQRKECIAINTSVFKERWGNFHKKWVKSFKNPINKIRKSFYEKAFITDCEKIYVINIFGKLFRIKKKL